MNYIISIHFSKWEQKTTMTHFKLLYIMFKLSFDKIHMFLELTKIKKLWKNWSILKDN